MAGRAARVRVRAVRQSGERLGRVALRYVRLLLDPNGRSTAHRQGFGKGTIRMTSPVQQIPRRVIPCPGCGRPASVTAASRIRSHGDRRGRRPAGGWPPCPASRTAVPVQITTDGVYEISERDYHADPVPGGSMSATGAKRMLDPSCPALFEYRQTHPDHRATFDFGSAAHRIVLGYGPRLRVIDADDWRTKAAKEQQAAARAAGEIPVLPHEMTVVRAMADAILAHPLASALLSGIPGTPEASLFWTDKHTGVRCRARLDHLPDPVDGERMVIVDYKTCVSAHPAAFAKAAHNYGYHMQDGFYRAGVIALGLDPDPDFVFVNQEKTEPYLVTVTRLDRVSRRVGQERNREALNRYRDCTEAGVWPGYSDPTEIVEVGIPGWAVRDHEEMFA